MLNRRLRFDFRSGTYLSHNFQISALEGDGMCLPKEASSNTSSSALHPQFCSMSTNQMMNEGQDTMTSSTRQSTWRTRSGSASSRSERTYVKHDYVDHYYDPIYRPGQVPVEEGQQVRRRGGARGGVVAPFPERLYSMLSGAEANGFEDIVSWQPHGRSFIVHKPREFVNEVMPKYFKQSKLTSFQRQVNLYGFRRLTAGRDRGSYYHELFLRGRPDLHKCLIRTRVKGNGFKSAASPDTEPDFYNSFHPCLEGAVGNQSFTMSAAAEAAEISRSAAVSDRPSVSQETQTNEAAFKPPHFVVTPALKPADGPPLTAAEEIRSLGESWGLTQPDASRRMSLASFAPSILFGRKHEGIPTMVERPGTPESVPASQHLVSPTDSPNPPAERMSPIDSFILDELAPLHLFDASEEEQSFSVSPDNMKFDPLHFLDELAV